MPSELLVNDYVRFLLTNLHKKISINIEVKKNLGVIFIDIIHGFSITEGGARRNSLGMTFNMLFSRRYLWS